MPANQIVFQETLPRPVPNKLIFGFIIGTQIKYWSGSSWIGKTLKKWNGSSWGAVVIKRRTVSDWVNT